MHSALKLLLPIALVGLLSSCKKETPEPVSNQVNDIPEFFSAANEDVYGLVPPSFTVLANSSDKLQEPQDLDFNKIRANELWVINKGTENTGGTTVTFTNTGLESQTGEYRKDGNSWHFMALPSALSFGSNGNWGTSPNILDANHNNGTFTGPTLWSSDMAVYAKPSGGNGSHLDMLHSSPYSMGIEYEKDNAYWLFDGYNKHLVRYDFKNDHGAGNAFHSDAEIHRYTEIKLKRDPGVPSHLVLDEDKKWLYIVDGGNKRVLRMDISSGNKLRDLGLINEQLAEHAEYTGVSWEVVIPATAGLKRPCGIDIRKNRLFVSDYETGDIICFDIQQNKEVARAYSGDAGIMGIKIGPDNRLWYVNALTNEMGRVDPQK